MDQQIDDENGKYLTVAEACKVASIGRSTFYRLLDNRDSGLADIIVRIPVIGHIRVPRKEFCLWLEGRLPNGASARKSVA